MVLPPVMWQYDCDIGFCKIKFILLAVVDINQILLYGNNKLEVILCTAEKSEDNITTQNVACIASLLLIVP